MRMALALNKKITLSPKQNDDSSLLIVSGFRKKIPTINQILRQNLLRRFSMPEADKAGPEDVESRPQVQRICSNKQDLLPAAQLLF
jgi:hypothetical protein